MKFLTNKAHKFEEKFTSKAGKIIAFWGALGSLIAMGSTIIAAIVWIAAFCVDLANLSDNTKKFNAAQEYNYFMINQLSRMIEAEADYKTSFGIPVRETNAPKGASSGDLWYPTYIKVNGNWHPIIYGAFPNMTRKQVGILDMHGDYIVAGKEPHPDKEELKKLHNH
jgi:hypothetical protein